MIKLSDRLRSSASAYRGVWVPYYNGSIESYPPNFAGGLFLVSGGMAEEADLYDGDVVLGLTEDTYTNLGGSTLRPSLPTTGRLSAVVDSLYDVSSELADGYIVLANEEINTVVLHEETTDQPYRIWIKRSTQSGDVNFMDMEGEPVTNSFGWGYIRPGGEIRLLWDGFSWSVHGELMPDPDVTLPQPYDPITGEEINTEPEIDWRVVHLPNGMPHTVFTANSRARLGETNYDKYGNEYYLPTDKADFHRVLEESMGEAPVYHPNRIVTSRLTDVSLGSSKRWEYTHDKHISNWDVSNIVDFSYLFNLSTFDTNSTVVRNMFIGWDTSKGVNFVETFQGVVGTQVPILNNLKLGNARDISYMFRGRDLSLVDFTSYDTSKVRDFSHTFSNTSNIRNLDSITFESAETLDSMFALAADLNIPIRLDTLNTSPAVSISMRGFLHGAVTYNAFTHHWNLSRVSNLMEAFAGCSLFNQPVHINSTISSIHLDWMFLDCSALNSPITFHDPILVISIFEMFLNATSFNQNMSNVRFLPGTNAGGYNYGANSWESKNWPKFTGSI